MKYNVLLLLIPLASALVIIDSSLASSCIYYFKNFDWGCGGTGQGHAMYMCRCYNVDWLGSVTNCMETQGASEAETRHAWKHLHTRCVQKAEVDYSLDQLAAYSENATAYMEYPSDVNLDTQTYHPLAVNESAYAIYKLSFDQMNHHVYKTQWFGWGLVFFWAAFLAVHTVGNILWTCFQVHMSPRTVRQWYNKHMTATTAVFSLTRLDLVLSLLFIIQATLSTALSYTVELPNMYINDAYFLTLDLIGYRSGIIAFSLMPVAFVFGLRNNPFCVLTGLPQAVLIRYHKLVAIVMCIEAMIHSAVWTAYAIRSGGYITWVIDDYWRWGIVGTVLIYLMMFQSVAILRKLAYEVFLLTHKVFGWLFIVAMWYHCNTLGWMGWVYSLIALTAYDRVMRLVKTFILNRGYTQIAVTVVSDTTLKISIPKSEVFHSVYKAGNHVYLSFYHWPIWYQCLQSHPYTIVSSPVESPNVVSIYVRVKRGTTKALASLRGDEKGVVRMWALIEGPYGDGVKKYGEKDAIVGIAGGLGLASLLPSLLLRPQGARLYWVVKHMDDVDFLHREVEYLRANGCEVHVFVNRSEVDSEEELGDRKFLTVVSERPNVDKWVSDCCEAQDRDIHVLSCGPGSMDDDVERSVRRHIVVGQEHSVYHQKEQFQW